MTAAEAEAAYQELSGEHQQSTGRHHVLAGFLNRLTERADALSNSLNRASRGMERLHHWWKTCPPVHSRSPVLLGLMTVTGLPAYRTQQQVRALRYNEG
jgi:hypothetical protein